MTFSVMNDPRIEPLLAALKTQLDTSTMRGICNPSGDTKACVFVAGLDEFSDPEGPEKTDWGRVVIVPTDTLWPTDEVEGWTRKLGFLVRTEFNNLAARGYTPMTGLELAQRESYHRLQRWAPTGLDGVLVAFPMYRSRAPQPIPQRDDERGLRFLSSEYRTEVSGITP